MSKEPNTLKIRLHQVKLSRSVRPIKVMLTGDWHISPIVSDRQATFLKEAIEKSEPDVIILQGDLMDSPTELSRETSLKKLMRELKICSKAAPTVAVLGNHDYITPINPIEVKKEFAIPRYVALCKKCNVKLLMNEWVELDGIRIFGAFQNEDCILYKTSSGKYLYKETAKNYEKQIKDYDFSNLGTDKINWFAAHIPLITPVLGKKLQEFDVMSFGHTHGGIVPRGIDEAFEKFGIHGGFYSAGKRPFPRKVRGAWKEKKSGNHVVVNAGMVGAQFCAPRIIQGLNFIKAAEVSLVDVTGKDSED
ncbi:metallophosphoesterase [Candidatus Saccharibacteria bacterium]|nr:metallophosphoesterase [Candidatus Saccharibacteria bacterium]